MRAGAALRRPGAVGARLGSALTPGPRLRRRALLAVLLAALLGALYMVWLRDSSLVAVERVTVTGVPAEDGARIRAALSSTAETMTTLHVDRDRLDRAAQAFPAVARVEASPDFPDAMTIHVVEHRPVALLEGAGEGVPVAADGSVLSGVAVDGELPVVDVSRAPQGDALPAGAAREAVAVAGTAPGAIVRRLDSVEREDGARGLVAQIDEGPEIVFGTTAQLGAKWAAATRVLADEGAAEAAYVDVRIPGRPVAGGLSAEAVTPPVDPLAVQ